MSPDELKSKLTSVQDSKNEIVNDLNNLQKQMQENEIEIIKLQGQEEMLKEMIQE